MAVTATAWAQEQWTDVSDASGLTSNITNGAQIRLTSNITLSEHLKIGQNDNTQVVTIDLNGHTLSRDLNAIITDGHVIEVYGAGTLTLQNGTISGGRATNGGGICNYGTVTLNNVTITDCKAENGGGIINNGGKSLTINGGRITNCRTDAGGGAIVNHGTANISGCTMSNNIATTRGGAIWSDGTVTVDGSTFNGNHALANGGDDQNEGNGGAIHVKAGTTTLTSVTITNNESKDAGAIYVFSGATLNINGTSTISGNTSSKHGGGGIVNQGTVNLSGSVSITGNTCHTKGSGIWSNGTLTMEGNIQVKNNTGDDVFLKKDKVITTGTLTGGQNSIGINMETPGVFTSGYQAHNAGNTLHFFPSGNGNTMGLVDGEGKMFYSYYEATWNSSTNEVEYTQCTVPDNVSVDNICSSKYASGGGLDGNSYWFVVDGTGSTANGLTCYDNTTVNLILCNNAQITLTEGLFVKSGSTLNIYCQSYGDNMGKLITQNPHEYFSGIGARGGDDGAGNAGTINIHGGDITARGGTNAAGIGGGYKYEQTYSCGTITIYGGKISATGGTDGAGIGCGCRGQGGSITIYGGDITATGGKEGAGIGGASYSANTTITINGGTISATGGGNDSYAGAAGIGGGYSGTTGAITINGGDITALGKDGGAGIGSGGVSTNSATITITGGTVNATGGNQYNRYGAGAGIGCGGYWDYVYIISGGTINISGGNITAQGGTGGAYYDSNNSYTPGGGAGIGSGGMATSGGTITISGGTIVATGGGYNGSPWWDGAGIGGGYQSSGATVVISGGKVTASSGGTGYTGSMGAKDIGRGHDNDNDGTLTIKNGAQVILTHDGVTATVEKEIEHYSGATGLGNTDGWYFIASPISTGVEPSNVTNMLTETYDLYRLNNTTWENFKALTDDPEPQPLHPDFTTLNNGAGYLYANSNNVTLKFTGNIKTYDAAYEVPVYAGFNLVGNPYTFDTYVNRPYYKMNDARKGVELVSDNAAIKPCDGVVINANSNSNVIFTQTPQQSQATGGNLLVTLAQANNTRDNSQIDNAIVSFNEGSTLPKFRFGENAEIYIPQGNEDYAIAFSDKQGELPLNFKATEDGTYTISVNPEGVEMAYLHLIDNLTGADIDLLKDFPPSLRAERGNQGGQWDYTFTAKTTDYASRFRLVFSVNGVSENDDSTSSATFAFISNGNIVVNGEGTLQVMDVTGRVIRVSTDVARNVSTNGMAPGVYVLRLINGERVSTQKIVID